MSGSASRYHFAPMLTALWLASVLGAWWAGSRNNGSQPAAQAAARSESREAGILRPREMPDLPSGLLRTLNSDGVAPAITASARAVLLAPHSVERERRYLVLLGGLTARELEALDKELTALEAAGQSLPWERVMFWRQWAELCPASALTYASADPARRSGMDTVLSTWAGTNGPAALQWLNEHSQLPQWPRLLEKVITGVALTDFQEAASLALEVASQRSETAPVLFATGAEQAIDAGQLDSATDLLHDLAAQGAPPASVAALAEGIRSSLRHRSADQARAWDASQQGAAWRKSTSDNAP